MSIFCVLILVGRGFLLIKRIGRSMTINACVFGKFKSHLHNIGGR